MILGIVLGFVGGFTAIIAFLTLQEVGIVHRALYRIEKELDTMNASFANLNDAIAALQADVSAEDTVIDSAVTLIQGIPALIQQAVQNAIVAGATPDQLAALGTLADTLTAKAQSLAAVVAAVPTATPTPAPTTSPATGG